MKIVTVITDGAGHVRLCATRSPDLLRRQVATETGHADLVGVCLAPDGLGPQALIALAALRLEERQIAPGLYAAPPAAVVKAVTQACRAHRRRTGIGDLTRRVLRPLRRAVRSLRRIDAIQSPAD
jgi:hypothetical protein